MTAGALALAVVLASAPDAGVKDLVDVTAVVPGLVVDLRYGTPDNVMGQAMYPAGARCLLVRPLAEALAQAAKGLAKRGYFVKAWDCYRPLSVQRALWKVMPKPGYVADPRTGSHHNRGAAIDLTLVGRDGGEVEMPSPYDTFGKPAHHWYQGGTESSRANRQLLRDAMEGAGLKRNPMEWWHYELEDAVKFPLRDEPFAAGDAGVPGDGGVVDGGARAQRADGGRP